MPSEITAGVTQWLECQPSKLAVVGSTPIARFTLSLSKGVDRNASRCQPAARGVFVAHTPKLNGRSTFDHSDVAICIAHGLFHPGDLVVGQEFKVAGAFSGGEPAMIL